MSAEEWTRVRAMFDDLADLDEQRRDERLAVIRSTDPGLASKLDELLVADADVESALAHIDAAIARVIPNDDGSEHQAEPDPLHLVGRTVSHFRIIEPLAAGGMGIVYRAEDTKLQRTVALKFPLPAHHFNRDGKERFLREARSAGALEHNNICSVHAIGETDDGHLFLAMPFYEGETLKTRLARERMLEPHEAIAIARQIALGLSAAHNAGIVHRDVKPANVMLLPDGTVKVLDFGLAKVRDLTLSAPSIRMGTVAYMSPEQIQGRAVDGRTDLWALGVVLYEMLGGLRPFAGDYDLSLAHAIMYAQPTSLSTLRSDLTPQLEALVSKLLSKDPAARFASAEEVVSALAVPHTAGARQTRPASSTQSPTRRPTRNTYMRMAVALTPLLVISLIAWSLNRKRNLAGESTPPTIIVLPFKDSTGNPNDSYLATGLSDGIGTELSRLRSAVVPSPRLMYANGRSTKSIPQVANDLGASAVVAGTVQRTGGRVHVAAHLIDVQSGQRVWEKVYDRPMKEMLAVQREATEAIIAALKLNVTKPERAVLAHLPTASPEAYDLFLRGRDAELRGRPTPFAPISAEYLREAQSYYSHARDLDPAFAHARARLGLMHMYSAMGYDSTTARREQARLEAEAAVRIEPSLGEAHEALAYYWDVARDDQAKALSEIMLAIDGFPNSVDQHRAAGVSYRRQGLWEEAIAELDRAMQLGPRNTAAALEAAMTYNRLRRYKPAVAAWDRLIALGPNVANYKVVRGYVFIRWLGTADTLAAVMRQLPASLDNNGMGTWARWLAARIQRRNVEALAILNNSKKEISSDDYLFRPRVLLLGLVYDALGEPARAQTNYELSRALLVDSLAVHPRDARMHIALGLSYAGLNRRREAMDEARRAVDLAPITKDNPTATAVMGGAAEVFSQAGAINEAIELLELLLAMPAGREVSVPQLRVDPAYDRLRSDPRFEQLLSRFATK